MRQCIIVELNPGSAPPGWLLSAWEKLVREHTEIRLFQTPNWVLNYWKYRYPEPKQLRLLVGKDGENIIGITPWVVHSRGLIPLLSTWRTVHALGEYDADWICHPEHRETFVRMVCDYLEREKQSWFRYLHSAMREDSAVLHRLKSECQSRGIPFRYQPSTEIPFLETSDPLPVDRRIPGKYRQETRRKERKLGRVDSVNFEDIVDPDPDSLPTTLTELFGVEAAGWKGRAGTAIAHDPKAERFWRAFAHEAAHRGWLRLHLLRLGNRAIAGQLGTVFGETYYSLKLGYDERFKSYGPGALLMRHTIQSCIDHPVISTYDFTGPAMPYMKTWTQSSRRAGIVTLGTPRRGMSSLLRLKWYGRKKLNTARSAVETVARFGR